MSLTLQTDTNPGTAEWAQGTGLEFIFRPLEPNPAGQVFSDWSLLYDAVTGQDLPVTIIIDPSLDPTPTPPAGDWDFSSLPVSIKGAGNTLTTLALVTGSVITNVRSYEFIAFSSTSTGNPIVQEPGTPGLFVGCTTGAFAGASLIDPGTNSSITFENCLLGTDTIDISTGVLFTMSLTGSTSNTLATAIRGTVNTTVLLGSSVRLNFAQTNYSGTFSKTFLNKSDGDYIRYTVATDPTNLDASFNYEYAGAGALAVTLFASAEATGPVRIKNNGGGILTVNADGVAGDSIDGGASIAILAGGGVVLISDGTNDWISI